MLKFRMYETLLKNLNSILDESRKAVDDIGIPFALRGNIGLSVSG